ncbi:hypothetical protein BU25DRAFT_411755 [Macroventuria anomochaeta]|uniref:Uncharacterized protein n=1 Tax=Macroventuria anomochaeta TaxID=301207 RepID=A0ACB6RY51_9PLEO|nr:uncharacterized protein BU25DRAFT_411755 [Macroventuria anomochaeta]KAF2626350.1 hypothetical protein BU25DRAFT_411755 [Macroventuria anomochaeta]
MASGIFQFQETTKKSFNLIDVVLAPTPSSADKAALDVISKQRTTIASWFRDVRGTGNSEKLNEFMKRWSEYSADLGGVSPADVTRASDLNASQGRSINALIYQTITLLNPNIAPPKPAQNPTVRKTPPSGSNDPDATELPSEVQKKAVEYLLSTVTWGNKGQNGLILNSATLVDWPAEVTPAPTEGIRVRYDGKNYYRVSVANLFGGLLDNLYREKGPTAFYAAIELLRFASSEKPFWAGGSRDSTPGFPQTAFDLDGKKSKVFTVYKDPNNRQTDLQVRTLDEWAKLSVVALVLQGFPKN